MNTDESYKKNGWVVKHLGIKEKQTLSATMAEKKIEKVKVFFNIIQCVTTGPGHT